MNEPMGEWWECLGFWEDSYPTMFYQEKFAQAPNEVTAIIAQAGICSGKVLDLCCGPGRHSVEFAKLGFSVTGIDVSPFLLKKAQERAAEVAVTVNWVEENVLNLSATESFDLIVSLFNSIGYFENPSDNHTFLLNAYRALKPEGVMVIEHLNKDWLTANLVASGRLKAGDQEIVETCRFIHDDGQPVRLAKEWTLREGDTVKHYDVTHYVYSRDELSAMLEEVGFRKIEIFGDLQGTPYSEASTRLVALCRK